MRRMDEVDEQWFADALTCAGIAAATEVEEKLVGDLDGWRPIGILNVPGVKVETHGG